MQHIDFNHNDRSKSHLYRTPTHPTTKPATKNTTTTTNTDTKNSNNKDSFHKVGFEEFPKEEDFKARRHSSSSMTYFDRFTIHAYNINIYTSPNMAGNTQ